VFASRDARPKDHNLSKMGKVTHPAPALIYTILNILNTQRPGFPNAPLAKDPAYILVSSFLFDGRRLS
jgi:hypothetical protein